MAAFGAAAAFGSRVGEPGGNEALVLETIQCDVDSPERDLFGTREFGCFGVDRNAVSVAAQREDGGEQRNRPQGSTGKVRADTKGVKRLSGSFGKN